MRVGYDASILDAIKHVMDVRKEQLNIETLSSDPFGGWVCHGQWLALRREGQLSAFARLQAQWHERHAARCLAQYVERVRASTPNVDLSALSQGTRERVLRGYFKTDLFDRCGGQHWVKFILAIGGVPEEAVDATNHVIEHRIRSSKNGRLPTTEAVPATTHSWKFQRESRRKRPCLDAGATVVYRAKDLRSRAKFDSKALEKDIAKAGWQATPEQQADFERRRRDIEERRPGGVFPHVTAVIDSLRSGPQCSEPRRCVRIASGLPHLPHARH